MAYYPLLFLLGTLVTAEAATGNGTAERHSAEQSRAERYAREIRRDFLPLAASGSPWLHPLISMAKKLSTKIHTEEFIGLLPARPALWQKAHPDFQNRDVRDTLLREMADDLSVTVSEVKERLKTLKDAMRKQVNSLPKTTSGAPAFDKSSQITWPYFTKLLFMKDEFIGRKMTSSHPGDTQCSGRDYDDQSLDDTNDQMEENNEEDVVAHALQASGISSAGSRCPSEASTSSASKSKRTRYRAACSDSIEQEKLNLLKETFAISRQKMEETKDPLEVFAMDLANDLKQIEDRRLLIQTKLELKQITTNALIKQIDTNCVQGASDVQQTHQTLVPTDQYSDLTDPTQYSSVYIPNKW